MCTLIHTHNHAYPHTHIHMCTQTHSQAHTCTCTYTCIHNLFLYPIPTSQRKWAPPKIPASPLVDHYLLHSLDRNCLEWKEGQLVGRGPLRLCTAPCQAMERSSSSSAWMESTDASSKCSSVVTPRVQSLLVGERGDVIEHFHWDSNVPCEDSGWGALQAALRRQTWTVVLLPVMAELTWELLFLSGRLQTCSAWQLTSLGVWLIRGKHQIIVCIKNQSSWCYKGHLDLSGADTKFTIGTVLPGK